jgi:hypothetical protein
MGCASLVLGILSLSGVLISLIPLLNVLNCVTLPMALTGAILGLVDLTRVRMPDEGRGAAVFGLILNGLALMIGMTRFLISIFTTGGII